MELHAGQVLELLDAQHHVLGQLIVEGREEQLLLGRFMPGPGFPAVDRLFRDFEEAANAQALAVLDDHDAAIAALGLWLREPGGSEKMDVKNVQIWSDGGISCRIGSSIAGTLNGKAQAATPVERMRKT